MLDEACKHCRETDRRLKEWHTFIGTTPELVYWRASLYQFGKKLAEWSPVAAIILLVAVSVGGAAWLAVWLLGYKVAIAYAVGIGSYHALYQFAKYLDRRGGW